MDRYKIIIILKYFVHILGRDSIYSSVADPVHFFSDPDPYSVLRYVLDVQQNEYFYLAFSYKT